MSEAVPLMLCVIAFSSTGLSSQRIRRCPKRRSRWQTSSRGGSNRAERAAAIGPSTQRLLV
eukprot:11406306-Prorocentrum_lima.AAC.1